MDGSMFEPGEMKLNFNVVRGCCALLMGLATVSVSGQEQCGNDYDVNHNGTVDIEDFLGILGVFGDIDSDSDGVWDTQDNCVDTDACNYDQSDAELCIYPDALGECFGNCPEDLDGDGVCDVFACGAPVIHQNVSYSTVLIGEQCWFAENLRNESYTNGDGIASGLNDAEWTSAMSGASTVFGEGDSGCWGYSPDGDSCDDSWSLSEYGRLYNWHCVADPRGLCPSGWHLPSDDEWTVLDEFLGGYNNAPPLKTQYGWAGSGCGTNETGFSALPGGFRSDEGGFYFTGYDGRFWTSTLVDLNLARMVVLYVGNIDVIRTNEWKTAGLSVRCIQDAE